MKWSMTTVGIIILGLIGVAIIILFQNLTTSSENDYYLLKEITESAMFDAIDISYYRETGKVKIVREKFVENFTRRYAESTLFIGGNYIISFFDVMEEPPKVSLLINTDIIDYQIYGEDTKDDYSVLNNLSGVFVYGTKNKDENRVYIKKNISSTYYSLADVGNGGNTGFDSAFNLPADISQREVKLNTINITFSNLTISNKIEDILQSKLINNIDWVSTNYSNNNYYSVIDSDKYSGNCNINDIYYYDCLNKRGKKNEKMYCDDNNNYWLHWDGNCNRGKENALLIFDMNFEYEEYEY